MSAWAKYDIDSIVGIFLAVRYRSSKYTQFVIDHPNIILQKYSVFDIITC